mmetsp:Transcript_54100/g.150070  ORF Transcript_54100/g.150070 Transcript_54100/m.150070 type:complete len:219 (-) Transcript_54100:1648-2304(-)
MCAQLPQVALQEQLTTSLQLQGLCHPVHCWRRQPTAPGLPTLHRECLIAAGQDVKRRSLHIEAPLTMLGIPEDGYSGVAEAAEERPAAALPRTSEVPVGAPLPAAPDPEGRPRAQRRRWCPALLSDPTIPRHAQGVALRAVQRGIAEHVTVAGIEPPLLRRLVPIDVDVLVTDASILRPAIAVLNPMEVPVGAWLAAAPDPELRPRPVDTWRRRPACD